LITRLYIKNCLSFEKVELEFNKGLNIFTGPSGAGKSILMQEILSLFALHEVKADMAEVSLNNSKIRNEEFDISFEEDIIIKSMKKDKTRYFLNSQSISKKALLDFSSKLIKYLSLRDTSDFESSTLIEFLDRLSSKNSIDFIKIKEGFILNYNRLSSVKKELNKLIEDEKRVEDLKEFARFEILKIEEIDPKIDEYEELNNLKKSLAKKEKIKEAINKSTPIFEYSNSVIELLDLLEEDSSFFDETINELNNLFEKSNDILSDLEDVNIEETLNRIEKIASLIKRFGSIQECLEYKRQKQEELLKYENISFEKEELLKEVNKLQDVVSNLGKEITKYRESSAKILENSINEYLKFLYLSNATINLNTKEMDINGCDEIKFELNGVSLQTISAGEYNRLRLALLSAISRFDIGENGILFLDEIDSNLSGKESEAISKVLIELSKNYQIFAISHQVQLTSNANQHFLVDKKDGISIVKLLNQKEKIIEVARMISGENITDEAIEFSKNLLK